MSQRHVLRSKAYKHTSGDVWWYAIPPLGKKYKKDDTARFVLRDFDENGSAEVAVLLDAVWVARLGAATKDRRGHTLVHIWRHENPRRCRLSIGARDEGVYEMDLV